MTEKKLSKEALYFQVTDLWKRLCEEHTLLLDVTCEEYSLLLSSQIEKLEERIKDKEVIIARIGELDSLRQGLIQELNGQIERPIGSVHDLLSFMTELDIEKEQKHLFRFNALLIDIIGKIQDQNKKNQLFLNKAIYSLREMRMDAVGKKNYSTYNSKGSTRASPNA